MRTLARGDDLSLDLARQAFQAALEGTADPHQMAGLLLGLRAKGETADELLGTLQALRASMIKVTLDAELDLVDTCGTGGGKVPTFNISTAAAIVAAACGVPVAKHGNRSFTSKCGSADVLEALGVPIAEEPGLAAQQLRASGMTFLFAPAFHPGMRHLGGVRRALGTATIMNLVGPLANPAGSRRQVVGVALKESVSVVADALARDGVDHALVVHGEVGMDEIAPSGVTWVSEVRKGRRSEWDLDPADFDLEHERLSDLAGGEPAENAERIHNLLLDPESDPGGRASVTLNAGAAVYVAGLVADYREGVERAGQALGSGRAAEVLALLSQP